MKTLGIDIGSSFIKVAFYDHETGRDLAKSQVPDQEMPIRADQPGWACQDPEMWWENTKLAILRAIEQSGVSGRNIGAIGITYQMHGLVYLDQHGTPLGDSIIWCDSRAVATGEMLADKLGNEYCQSHLLNLPGNFTASKLRWIRNDDPVLYEKIRHILLPGDYIGYRLTGDITTTITGLSEGIFWDFRHNQVSEELLEVAAISKDLLPDTVPVFGLQGKLLPSVALELGLNPGTPVAYRAGDQPNNAFSLNVNKPGEVAATAGTSGVVYGVTDQLAADPLNRINTFAHVNHTVQLPRLGILLCINGTGILNSWLRKNVATGMNYEAMNHEALKVSPGSEGLLMIPFGNGAERMLQHTGISCRMSGLNFNRHGTAHILRAAQEGIAYAFRYGVDIMKASGMNVSVIRAGNTNMFQSELFRQTLADVCQVTIDLYETDGATGAAIGAAVGAGFCPGVESAFSNIKRVRVIEPSADKTQQEELYYGWKRFLENSLEEDMGGVTFYNHKEGS